MLLQRFHLSELLKSANSLLGTWIEMLNIIYITYFLNLQKHGNYGALSWVCYLKLFLVTVIHEGCCVLFFLFFLSHISLRHSEMTTLSATDRQISWNENYKKK